MAEALPDGDADAWRMFRERTSRDEDLISALPDKLIGHIFSFLDIKDIMKTTILSKRWQHCWMQTPTISIDGKEPGIIDGIDRILLVLESSELTINKFCLKSLPVSSEPSEMDRYDNWLIFAIRHRVKELSVEFSLVGYHLPEEILECQTMVAFFMQRCDFPYMLVEDELNVCWDSLRLFSIFGVELCEEIMTRVLRGCPVLQRLVLLRCYSIERVEIRSEDMSELFINGYSNGDPSDARFRSYKDYNKYKYEDEDDEDEEDCDNTLKVCAPQLRSLRLMGTWRCKTKILLRGISSLMEARLDFQYSNEKDLQDAVRYVLNILLQDLGLVEKLYIGRFSLQVLLTSKLRGGDRQFKCRYLSTKELADQMGFMRIVEILKYTPSVQKLEIDLTPKYPLQDFHFDSQDNLVQNTFDASVRNTGNMKCLAESLVSIDIKGFGADHQHGSMYELLLVEFLLKHSLRLEKMVLHYTSSWEKGNHETLRIVTAKVGGFRRGSEAAKVMLRFTSDGTETVITRLSRDYETGSSSG